MSPRRLHPLEKSLDIRFNDRELLRLALMHSSSLNENGEINESNERLEFLGDALLGFIVAKELYGRFQAWSEGELTQARSAVVSGDSLAKVADRMGLGKYLQVGRGEEASGGRRRPTNLAATFASLVGALFLDKGYTTARDFVIDALGDALAFEQISIPKNSKSALQEKVQTRGLAPPTYQTVAREGEEHARMFTVEVRVGGKVLGKGTGKRKSQAEQVAAADALNQLIGLERCSRSSVSEGEES